MIMYNFKISAKSKPNSERSCPTFYSHAYSAVKPIAVTAPPAGDYGPLWRHNADSGKEYLLSAADPTFSSLLTWKATIRVSEG
jgi:hypothetical protein